MMTTIKATCPTCGEVGLTPDDIDLRVDAANRDSSYYAFECPACSCTVRKPADERVVRLLVSGGVEVHDAHPNSLQPRFAHPTLTHDDLLDFHTLLATDGWFDQLLGSARAT